MAKKKVMQPKFICVDCKKEPEPDKEQSTKNWNVAPKECPSCGGKITIKFD